MISRAMSLAEVAAAVTRELRAEGIEVCIVGGSALTMHAPQVYTSLDIDFCVLGPLDVRRIERVFRSMGYEKKDRVYAHSDSKWTLDIMALPPTVDSRPIERFDVKKTPLGDVRTLRIEDSLADRVACFVHWSDSEALAVAARVAKELRATIDRAYLREALDGIDPEGSAERQRLDYGARALRQAQGDTDSP